MPRGGGDCSDEEAARGGVSAAGRVLRRDMLMDVLKEILG